MVRRRLTATEMVRRYYMKHPNAKYSEVAAATGIDIKHLYAIKHRFKREADTAPPIAAATLISVSAPPDLVNHPPHYTLGGIETIDFIEAKKLNYNLGNAVKYLTRAEHKGNKLEDLRKAQWYLVREINSTTQTK